MTFTSGILFRNRHVCVNSSQEATRWLRASSYEHVNRVGSVTGSNFALCSYGKFQLGEPRCNQRNTTKMVEHKLVSFAAVVALWTLQILLTKLIRLYSLSGNACKTKVMPFPLLCCESKAILSKKFSFRIPGLECSYGKIFRPVSARSPSRLLIWTDQYFYEWKSGEARSQKLSQPGLFKNEKALRSVFHLSCQICGSFIEAFRKTGLNESE